MPHSNPIIERVFSNIREDIEQCHNSDIFYRKQAAESLAKAEDSAARAIKLQAAIDELVNSSPA